MHQGSTSCIVCHQLKSQNISASSSHLWNWEHALHGERGNVPRGSLLQCGFAEWHHSLICCCCIWCCRYLVAKPYEELRAAVQHSHRICRSTVKTICMAADSNNVAAQGVHREGAQRLRCIPSVAHTMPSLLLTFKRL